MTPFRFFLCCLLLAGPAVAGQPVRASLEGAVRVTTDSAAYCDELSARLALLPATETRAVRSLADEGAQLCREGHVRTGIAKLRRALRAAHAMGG